MRPIPEVDPSQKKNRLQRTMEAGVATPAGTGFFKYFVSHVEPTMIKLSGGRLQFGAGPRVNLTVVGRKSGQARTTTLLYFTHEGAVILIASNFGGKGHPAWYLNLAAAGECELEWRGGNGRYQAREAEGEERERLYELATKFYSGYTNYAAKTDGVRKIPVLVLTPASS